MAGSDITAFVCAPSNGLPVNICTPPDIRVHNELVALEMPGFTRNFVAHFGKRLQDPDSIKNVIL